MLPRLLGPIRQIPRKAPSLSRQAHPSLLLHSFTITNIPSDYDTRKQHNVHKALIEGPTPPILKNIQSNEHVYVVHPNAADRRGVYYAPYTTVAFFWGIDEDKWTDAAPALFAAVAKADACTGYFWGEVDKPLLADPSGFASLGSGRCGVLAAGWHGKEQYERDMRAPRAVAAWKAMNEACVKTDTWGTTLTVTENTGHIHRWHTPLPLKDRADWLAAAGTL